MKLSEAISILKIHQQWRLGIDIVMIEPKEITKAINTIIELADPKLLEGTTPNAWDMHFRRKLQGKLEDLSVKHIESNNVYADGLLDGFEMGAEWVWENFKLEIK